MDDLINRILTAPINAPLLMAVSVAYAVLESIRIYDARLIQAKTRGFYCGVALEAEGRCLPNWVGYIHFAGWVLFAVILILDWTYAIALYAVLFLLRVVPVLERIGALIMRPFLKAGPRSFEIETAQLEDEIKRTGDELSQVRNKLSKSRQDIEEAIHSIGPGNKRQDFVPALTTWWLSTENQALDLEQALKAYVEEFNLHYKKYPDEPQEVTMDRSMLKVLESSDLSFQDTDSSSFALYKASLRLNVRNHEQHREMEKLRKKIDREED